MYELQQEDFYKVTPLLNGGHLHPEILSIIEGNNPGWIFVDQSTQPRSALVWSKGIEGFYLIGDHTNQAFINTLDGFIASSIVPRMRELGLDRFEVSGHHKKWDLNVIFSSRNLHQFEQMVFKLFHKPPVSETKGLKIINLRLDEWENQGLINLEFVKEHINLFWSTKDVFSQKGYGFAAVEGLEIIGLGYSSFVTEDTHAIGIETLLHYQNKGVGTHLATLLVEDILANGFTPYWDCSSDNEASKKLAQRLGFQQVHQYKCSSFSV